MCFATAQYQRECAREYEYVSERRKPVIPVIMEHGFEPSSALGLLFGQIQRVHMTSPSEFDGAVEEILLRLTRPFV